MGKILVGALVCAAAAAVIYYLRDPQKFNETVSDLKNKTNDALTEALNKVKEGYNKKAAGSY